MKQAKLNIALFLIVIFGLAATNLLHAKKDKVSELEQREIQQRPVFTVDRLFEGKFTREYDNFFADNFAFRTPLIKAGSEIKQLKGFEGNDGAMIFVQSGGDNMAVDMNEKENGGAKGSDTKYYYYKDRALTLYVYTPAAAEMYADALNRFKASVDSGVNVYSMVVPTSVEFVDDKQIKELSDSQKDAIAHLNDRLDAGIVRVGAYDALAKHADEYIYFRTDHHWTALGAYYAYGAFMEAAGEAPVALDKYSSEDIDGFLGTSYKFTLWDKLKDNADKLTFYVPFTKYKYTMHTSSGKALDRKVVDANFAKNSSTFYAAFLGGDYPWGEIQTDNKNGKRIVVVKDSYGNAFVPFLLPHYEEVFYYDPRHSKDNLIDFVKEKKITDVLFLNNTTVARQSGIAKLLNEKMDLVKE